MPLEERKDRWNAMMTVLRANSIHDWTASFLQALGYEHKEIDDPLIEDARLPATVGLSRTLPLPASVGRHSRRSPVISPRRGGRIYLIEIGDRHEPPLFPEQPIRKARDVAHMDARANNAAALRTGCSASGWLTSQSSANPMLSAERAPEGRART
jgi:hypothetical protein